MGGGLIRSPGGRTVVKAGHRTKNHIKSDERILGDGESVSISVKRGEKIDKAGQLELVEDYKVII